ncbi:murein biosynthesis integral membrane protein MurJ [Ancylobacter mangrovi]|uniref:murein biosynthesis integral membrane protein MurJ n=1 Tax=Ancylobacter mangrovi TaxID=2972472 RepID=UPI0021638FB4|nr:lipid II flippase MurJ [Ancylobacter mangrovi]MCS0502354.1 polysaccharide biosynthesis C-terminal domain-containing protein [Ancylobacter mangrovi]
MALLRRASTVALITLGSRGLGFVRDAMVAALFGTGLVADASVAGLVLPQLARRLLGEGALNAAILPALVRAEADRRARLAGAALVLFALAAFAAGLVLFVFMPVVIGVLAPGFELTGPRGAGAVMVGRIAVVCVPLALLAGVLAALANAAGRYAAPAFGPVAGNVAVIALVTGLMLAGGRTMAMDAALTWLAVAAIAGAVTQFALVAFAVPRSALAMPRREDLARALPMLGAALPSLFAAALPQLRFLVAAAAASGIAGGVAALFYATRLVELPLGLVGASAGAVLLPALAGHDGKGRAGARSVGAGGIEAALALSLPAALGLAVLAEPVVAVLFQRGAFGAEATRLTATAMALLALTLPLQASEKVLAAIAFTEGLSRLVARCGVAGLILGGITGFAGMPWLGIAGPALGVLVSSAASLAGLALGLGRRRLVAIEADGRRRLRGLAGAALVMAGAVALARLWAAPALAAGGLAGAAELALLVVLGVAVYAGAARLLGGIAVGTLRSALKGDPR